MITDEPEWQTRAKTIGQIAFSMSNFDGLSLELRLSPKKITLVGIDYKEEIYSTTIDDNHSFDREELLKEAQDIIEACGRAGYSTSRFSRLLLNVGYVPKTIPIKQRY